MGYRDYRYTASVHCFCESCKDAKLIVEISEVTAHSELQDAADTAAQEEGWGDAETCGPCHAANGREAHELEKAYG